MSSIVEIEECLATKITQMEDSSRLKLRGSITRWYTIVKRITTNQGSFFWLQNTEGLTLVGV
jgi:hypothetical protein